MTDDLQPDQRFALWGDHVHAYERLFEPLTNRFAGLALAALDIGPGMRCLDVAAGSGGAALMAARTGAQVLAIDASVGMAARIAARAHEAQLAVRAAVMDAQQLACASGAFDAAFSVFGLILCPDAAGALRETARAVRSGGRIAVVTWSEPESYELVARLLAAIATVIGPVAPPPQLPAQLRFRDEGTFRALFDAGCVVVEDVRRITANLEAPTARWLAGNLDFAPGMAAMIASLGEARPAVLDRFTAELERDQGTGPVRLGAVALLAVGRTGETFQRSAT